MQAAARDFVLVPVLLDGRGIVQGAKSRHCLVFCRIGAINAVPVGGVPENVVDEATVKITKPNNTQCELILDQWEIKYQRSSITRVTLTASAKLTIENGLELVHDRLIRDDTHRTGLGVRTIQCALRARQRFDAFNVHGAKRRL